LLETGLILIIALVLILPVTVHFVERNLEAFLMLMGVLAATISHYWGASPVWSTGLVLRALEEPLLITAVVFGVGLIIYFFRDAIAGFIAGIERKTGPRVFSFFLITVLGVFSSVITAIMAAVILSEVVSVLRLDKKYEIKLVVLACFSIGLGAALTPVGEPLSTICISALKGEPYNAGFFFLLDILGIYVIPGVVLMGLIGYFMKPPAKQVSKDSLSEKKKESLGDVVASSAKVYVFIVALVLLGEGFKPIIDKYIIKLPGFALYWINMVSAIMDNATLTAAEISPMMSLIQIKYVLMGLLISGGMLIPGNIPNIIAAGKLNIKSKEWARAGVPLGLALMALYFVIFLLH
jgi:predicted cation transporter